ncbi:uncharacterized protein LOC118461115 [Anopheles albimanus]|uniref:uncharacterized protein LOC118461115 n=1 Tax=Anopheles albimanus TaxID=7167 RepID=UPI00163DEDB1|nr:uncharacterized protein LOC118461115 [Anopheles albimanus]
MANRRIPSRVYEKVNNTMEDLERENNEAWGELFDQIINPANSGQSSVDIPSSSSLQPAPGTSAGDTGLENFMFPTDELICHDIEEAAHYHIDNGTDRPVGDGAENDTSQWPKQFSFSMIKWI